MERSLTDSMTSSMVKVLGGLAVENKEISLQPVELHDGGGVDSTDKSPETNSQDGVLCLLEPSLVKLSREPVDVMLSQRSDDDSTSLPWSSPLDVEVGRSSFRGILGYSCNMTSL